MFPWRLVSQRIGKQVTSGPDRNRTGVLKVFNSSSTSVVHSYSFRFQAMNEQARPGS